MLDFHGLLIIMVVMWTAGKLFRNWGLPVVFGELIAGIIIGPSLLNVVHDGPVIEVIAELGVFFLMLHAGLETDIRELLYGFKQSLWLAILGLLAPFIFGAMYVLYFGGSPISALFASLCLSLTSIVFVARTLKDQKLPHNNLRHVLIAAAIINDVVGLVLFSVLIALHDSGTFSAVSVSWLLVKITLFFVGVFIVGKYISPRLRRFIYFGNKGFTLTLIIALVLGIVAEYIGLHLIIGAFLAGLFISAKTIDKRVFTKIEDRVYALSYSFFGPVFFVSIAFAFDMTIFANYWGHILAFCALTYSTKYIATFIGAKMSGFSTTESRLSGALMNARGSIDLVLAAIGLSKGIITETVFSFIVVITIFTALVGIFSTSRLRKELTT